jgi:Secretion system C-terminal sorting domain
MYLKHHFNFLSSDDYSNINKLANSCPFIAGDAVYEIRYYDQQAHPDAFYDDRQKCKKDYKVMEKNNTANNSIKVYPNPANAEVMIEYNCDTDGEFVLLNTIGKIIYNAKLPANKQKIVLNLLTIPSGIYLYKCIFKNCPTQTGKLIINQN